MKTEKWYCEYCEHCEKSKCQSNDALKDENCAHAKDVGLDDINDPERPENYSNYSNAF